MYSFSLSIESVTGATVYAQVVQAHIGMPLARLLEEIYDNSSDDNLKSEMLIIRLPVEESYDQATFLTRTGERAERFFSTQDNQYESIFRRIRDRSVHVLGSEQHQHFLTANINPLWSDDPLARSEISQEAAIKALQKAEFKHLLEKSRAVITSPPGSVFRTPSNHLVRSFVRVGNIQYDRDAIDAVFFWLLPYISDVKAIITDTWSISSIAYNAAKSSGIYGSKSPLRVELLSSYNDIDGEVDQGASRIIARLESDCAITEPGKAGVLCLISATQTGNFASRLQNIFDSSSFSLTPKFVAIFALGRTGLTCLYDLREDSRFNLFSEAGLAPGNPVNIDPQVYFPLQFQDVEIGIKKDATDITRPFFDNYAGSNLISVHRNHESGFGRGRHYGIYLNTEHLLENEHFRTRFKEYLSELSSAPRFIVCPPHEAGRRLGEFAKNYFDAQHVECVLFIHPTLFIPATATGDEEALRNAIHSIKNDESILVIDDACITGTHLSQYQRYLRTEGYVGRIDYIVGIARPSDAKIWSSLQRYLSFRNGEEKKHTVKAVDFIVLPNWREDECPWCREKNLYARWMSTAKLPGLLMDRFDLLGRSSEIGLTDDLFLKLPDESAIRLGPDSLYTVSNSNQAEVFSALAAVLQLRRTAPIGGQPPLGPRHFPIATVLNFHDYLEATWTDSILRASFFRGSSAEELIYSDTLREKQRIDAIIDLLTNPAKGEYEIYLELLLAANLGKCELNFDPATIDRIKAHGSVEVFNYLLDRLNESRPRPPATLAQTAGIA